MATPPGRWDRLQYEAFQVWDESGASPRARPGAGGFNANWDTFTQLGGVQEMTSDEVLTGWEHYVDVFVNDEQLHQDPGNDFFEYMGMDPRDFDWEAWRDANGYSRH